MTILTKTEVNRRRRARQDITIQEALENQLVKDSLLKGIKETLLNELKEHFKP